jgi:hypothetical protein
MGYTIEIITEGKFTKDMYCRPLSASFEGQSDTFMTESMGGTSINNFKWLPITHFLGLCWLENDRTIQDYEKGPHTKMEWARGNIPRSHILHDSLDICLEQKKLRLYHSFVNGEIDEKEYKKKLIKLAIED